MAVSKAQQASVNKYVKANYDRINVTFPKGQKDILRDHAAARGESVNSFIGRAVSEAMERDSSGMVSESRQNGPESAVMALPPETLEVAQRAAEATGEATEQFISRAIGTQAQRDKSSLRMGLNPVTGDKLEQSGGVEHE